MNTKINYDNWMKSRNFNLYDYQKDVCVNQIPHSLKNNILPTVLAVTAGGGKTIITIYQIEQHLKENSESKILVFTHGTEVLRSQFYDDLLNTKPNFTFKVLQTASDLQKYYNNHNVFIALPHTFIRMKNLKQFKFDFLVVDEAHQFYFAKNKNGNPGMIQKIIKECKPKFQLLLTGTPSPFVYKKYPIIAVSANEIMDTGQLEDVLVELSTSTYNIKASDFNNDHNLKPGVKLTKKQTDETLWLFLQQMVERLIHTYRNEPEKYAEWKFAKNWSWNKIKGNVSNFISPSKVGKIMIACHNQNQAKNVASFFDSNGINVALSTSDTDLDSQEIKRFKEDKNCTVLIVVYRGILGFNLKELEIVVDMTGSENFDRIFQLMARILRVHPEGKKKIFFKIAPQGLEDYFEFVMSGVLCLTDRNYLTTYNGKNFLDFDIPITKVKNIKEISNENKQAIKKESRKQQIKNIQYIGLPAIRFFKDIIHKNNDNFNSYAFAKMREIRNLFLSKANFMGHGFWTLKILTEEALKFNSKKEFKKNSPSAYTIAVKNNWLEKICKHMDVLRRDTITFEYALNDASNYQYINDWSKNSPSVYNICLRNGWKDKVVEQLNLKYKTKKGVSDLEIIKNAKKYQSIGEWNENSTLCQVARGRGKDFFAKCVKHMLKGKPMNGFWSIDKNIYEDALKHPNIKSWKEKSPGAYSSACKLKIVKQATKHMNPLWQPSNLNLSKCIDICKKFNNRKDLKKEYPTVYGFITLHKLQKKCFQHMEKLKPKSQYTKQKCLTISNQYKSITEWITKSRYSYDMAKKNNWLFETKFYKKSKYNCLREAKKHKTPWQWLEASPETYNDAKDNGWFEECCKNLKSL